MDPETALELVKHGATLLLLDVPQYTLFGVDTQVKSSLLLAERVAEKKAKLANGILNVTFTSLIVLTICLRTKLRPC